MWMQLDKRVVGWATPDQPGRLADAGTHPPIPFSQEKSKAWCGWHLLDSTPAELPGQLQIRKLQAEPWSRFLCPLTRTDAQAGTLTLVFRGKGICSMKKMRKEIKIKTGCRTAGLSTHAKVLHKIQVIGRSKKRAPIRISLHILCKLYDSHMK